jgi:hypothetical protein
MVTAILITMLLLSVTLSAVGFVDTQQRESGRERKREATFQLSEGVMNSQIFLLSRDWPGTGATAYPTACSPANQADLRCPDTTLLTRSFAGPDYAAGISWTTEVHDNTIPNAENYYEDAFVRQQPRWDANSDGFMWVRAEGTLADGRTRAIVALVRAEQLITNFPRHAVVAGSIDLTQNGNQVYLNTTSTDAGGNVNGAGRVVVRCSPPTAAGCAAEGKEQQISPATVESNLGMPSALTPEVIERLRENARANGTYFGSGQCPASLAGDLVFLENPTGCRFGVSGAVWNAKGDPGVVIIGSGSFYLEHVHLYALVYHVNGSDGAGAPVANGTPAITLKNNGIVEGQVIIDGSGELEVGNNSGGSASLGNVIYDANVVNNLRAFGTAGIVQNSFREIYASGGGY